MILSIIVPTYNRLASLRRLLEALSQQSLPATEFELVIVDDGSTDETQRFLSQACKGSEYAFTFLSQANRGPAAARNAGLRVSRGDIVVFTDDDCVPTSDWLKSVAKFFHTNSDFAGCGGRIERLRDTRISRYIDGCGAMRHPLTPEGTAAYLVTANAAYRRQAVEGVGGFREDITWPGGEDPDLSRKIVRQGGRLAYADDCVVRHDHRDTCGGVYKMFYNHGRGSAYEERGDGQRDLTPMIVFKRYIRIALASFILERLPIADRLTYLLCGLMRAIGFARGRSYQMKRRLLE